MRVLFPINISNFLCYLNFEIKISWASCVMEYLKCTDQYFSLNQIRNGKYEVSVSLISLIMTLIAILQIVLF